MPEGDDSMSINYDWSADYYDDLHGFPPHTSEKIADTIVSVAAPGSATRFLELGIGTGRVGLPLIKRGYRYHGIDLSWRMMERLRAKLAPETRPLLVQGNVTQLPYQAESFDAILAVHVLDVVSNWRAALDEMLRVLRSGGVFMQSTRWSSKGSLNWWMRHKLSDVVAELGAETKRPGVQDPEDIDARLQALGATMTEVTAAEWTSRSVSAEMILEQFARRMYVNTVSVPDDILKSALTRLRELVCQQYGTVDYTEPEKHRFSLHVFRFPNVPPTVLSSGRQSQPLVCPVSHGC